MIPCLIVMLQWLQMTSLVTDYGAKQSIETHADWESSEIGAQYFPSSLAAKAFISVSRKAITTFAQDASASLSSHVRIAYVTQRPGGSLGSYPVS